jgi:hypothetical protein
MDFTPAPAGGTRLRRVSTTPTRFTCPSASENEQLVNEDVHEIVSSTTATKRKRDDELQRSTPKKHKTQPVEEPTIVGQTFSAGKSTQRRGAGSESGKGSDQNSQKENRNARGRERASGQSESY